MILKVKGYDLNDWQIFDEIKNIHYDYTTRGQLNNPNSGKIDVWIDARDKTYHPATNEFIKCILDRSDSECVVVFETYAYLCNDNGQTIEKLTPFEVTPRLATKKSFLEE